jgi:hypothetical protein
MAAGLSGQQVLLPGARHTLIFTGEVRDMRTGIRAATAAVLIWGVAETASAQQWSTGSQQPLVGSYSLQQPLVGSYSLQQPLIGSYALKQPLIGSYSLQQPLVGSYSLQQPMGGLPRLQLPPIGDYSQRSLGGSYGQQPPMSSFSTQQSPGSYGF